MTTTTVTPDTADTALLQEFALAVIELTKTRSGQCAKDTPGHGRRSRPPGVVSMRSWTCTSPGAIAGPKPGDGHPVGACVGRVRIIKCRAVEPRHVLDHATSALAAICRAISLTTPPTQTEKRCSSGIRRGSAGSANHRRPFP